MSKKTSGILLINLGSPDSTDVADVRRYLKEFLSDPRVLDMSDIKRQAILNLFILPFRPKESAHAYQEIWTEEGSPLIIITEESAKLLREKVDLPIAVGMRYGNPSTEFAIRELLKEGVDDIFLIPLYPHFAMSSYETAVAKVQAVLAEIAPDVELTIQPPFYDDPGYIEALVEPAKEYLARDYDHLLFSYHGIPERHLRVGDPSGCYCLQSADCCDKVNPMHTHCYRAQCFATTRAFVKAAGVPEGKYSVSFQSRLGKDPWLKPYTDFELEKFPSQNIKRVLVISPAFTADCLETIEELGMRGKEDFLKAGGKEYHLIPCMNTHPRWIETLRQFVENFTAGAYRLD